jgi:hypothetical protein
MLQNYTHQLATVRSTVLFVDGIPVGYKIYRNGTGFVLHPADIPGKETRAPLISATHRLGHWEIENLGDQNLIDQVVEDLDLLITEPVM